MTDPNLWDPSGHGRVEIVIRAIFFLSESVARKCSIEKKVLLNILWNSLSHNPDKLSFLKLTTLHPLIQVNCSVIPDFPPPEKYPNYPVRILTNTTRKNSGFGHFSPSVPNSLRFIILESHQP